MKVRKHIKYRNKIKNIKNYEIWIINDRRDRAGDNGEYFFRYLKMKRPEGIKYFFAIERICPDYRRLKKFDNILDLNSYKYKLIFLESNKIITSIYDSWVYNPFNNKR